jgi:hypothetical protein
MAGRMRETFYNKSFQLQFIQKMALFFSPYFLKLQLCQIREIKAMAIQELSSQRKIQPSLPHKRKVLPVLPNTVEMRTEKALPVALRKEEAKQYLMAAAETTDVKSTKELT